MDVRIGQQSDVIFTKLSFLFSLETGRISISLLRNGMFDFASLSIRSEMVEART